MGEIDTVNELMEIIVVLCVWQELIGIEKDSFLNSCFVKEEIVIFETSIKNDVRIIQL